MIENSSTGSKHNVSLGFFFIAAAASQRVACAFRFCMHKHKLLENEGRTENAASNRVKSRSGTTKSSLFSLNEIFSSESSIKCNWTDDSVD